jgi:hypothetical protein
MKMKRIFEKIVLVLFIGPVVVFLGVLFGAAAITLLQGHDVDRGMLIGGLLLTGLGMVTFTRVLLGKSMLPMWILGDPEDSRSLASRLSFSAIEIVATTIWLVAFIIVRFSSAFLDANGQVSYTRNSKAEDMLATGGSIIVLMWGMRTTKRLIKKRSK